MEAGPGPDLLLVMGLMRRQTRSIMAVVMVMTTNQVKVGLPAELPVRYSVQCLCNVCSLSVQDYAQ